MQDRISEESFFDIPEMAGSINTKFGEEEVLRSLEDVEKFAILTCGAAALLIFSTGSSRSPYSQPHQTGLEINLEQEEVWFSKLLSSHPEDKLPVMQNCVLAVL